MLRIAILCLLFCGLAGCNLFRQTDAERAAGVDAPGVAAGKAAGDALMKGAPAAAAEGPVGWILLVVNAVGVGANAFFAAQNRRKALALKEAGVAPSGP